MNNNQPLTKKQEAFVLEYLKTGNASEAYRRCYSASKMTDKQVWEEASKLNANPKVAQRVISMRAAAERKAEFSAADVLNEVKRLSTGSIKGILKDDGTLKMPHELDDETAAMVASFKINEKGEIEYKFWDKNAALEKAAKFFGMYEKDNQQKASASADTLLKAMAASDAYKEMLNGS